MLFALCHDIAVLQLLYLVSRCWRCTWLFTLPYVPSFRLMLFTLCYAPALCHATTLKVVGDGLVSG